jgi:membrane protein implicated in regulation of membrane protease activity
MKRPGAFTYLVGNPLSALAILGFAGFLVYQWWIGQSSYAALMVAVVLTGVAMNANQQIADFNSWKRSWDAMGGIAPGRRWTWLRKPLAGLIWLGGAYGATKLDPHRPETQFAITAYAIGSALIVVIMLYRLGRRWVRRRPRRQKEVPVSIALRVPRRSPGPQQFYKGVPVYCAKLSATRS